MGTDAIKVAFSGRRHFWEKANSVSFFVAPDASKPTFLRTSLPCVLIVLPV
jgi:hypothetical protein